MNIQLIKLKNFHITNQIQILNKMKENKKIEIRNQQISIIKILVKKQLQNSNQYTYQLKINLLNNSLKRYNLLMKICRKLVKKISIESLKFQVFMDKEMKLLKKQKIGWILKQLSEKIFRVNSKYLLAKNKIKSQYFY